MRQRHHLFFSILVGIFILLEFSLYLSLSLFFPVNRRPYCSVSTPVEYSSIYDRDRIHLTLDVPHSMLIDHRYPIKLTLGSDDTTPTLDETLAENEHSHFLVNEAVLNITASGNHTSDLEGKVFHNFNRHNVVGVWSLALRWQRAIHLSATLGLSIPPSRVISFNMEKANWDMICAP